MKSKYDIDGFRDYLTEEELSENTIEVYVYGVKKYAGMFDEITNNRIQKIFNSKFQATNCQHAYHCDSDLLQVYRDADEIKASQSSKKDTY